MLRWLQVFAVCVWSWCLLCCSRPCKHGNQVLLCLCFHLFPQIQQLPGVFLWTWINLPHLSCSYCEDVFTFDTTACSLSFSASSPHTRVCVLLRSMELLISRVGSSAGVIILLQMLGLGWEPKWCKEREGNRRKASCCHYSSTPLHQLISSSLPEAPPPPPPSPH